MRQSKVKRLHSKKLQNFVAKTQKEIIQNISDSNRHQMVSKDSKKTRSRAKVSIIQPIEYQKINMEALDSSLLESGSYDDKPMIFVGKSEEEVSSKILKNPEQVERIIKSFQNFRDIIESMEQEQIEHEPYRYVRRRAMDYPMNIL